MGFSEKLAVDMAVESEGKKWVIAGIPLRAPLKPLCSNPVGKEEEADCEETSTTPTGEESRIRTGMTCPAPPRKRKAALKCKYGGVREFFNPPDLETVFMVPAEKAN